MSSKPRSLPSYIFHFIIRESSRSVVSSYRPRRKTKLGVDVLERLTIISHC